MKKTLFTRIRKDIQKVVNIPGLVLLLICFLIGTNVANADASFFQMMQADLELTITMEEASLNPGDQASFVIEISNNGPNDATGIDVEAVVPNGYSAISNISSSGSVSGSVVTWTDLSVSNGSTIGLSFQAIVEAPDAGVSFVTTAEVIDSDLPDPDSDPDNDDGDQSEDDEDNISSCLPDGIVIDTMPPIVICPPSITVDCGDELDPLLNPFLGFPEVIPVCSPVRDTTYTDEQMGLLDCNADPAYFRVDRTWIVSDTSGNSTSCVQEIYVIDTVAPTAACNHQVNVGLGQDGETVITPDMIDADSPDNCGIFSYEIDIENHPDSLVTCAEAGDTLKVVLTVTDYACNQNKCWGLVYVEDKIEPVVACQDVTISCLRSLHPDSVDIYGSPMGFGYPEAFDTCSIESFTYTDDDNTNSCNIGLVERTWIVRDPSGNSASCVQSITVEAEPRPDIIWPLDLYTSCPDVAGNLDPDDLDPPYDKPKLASNFPDFCGIIQFAHEDQNFDLCNGSTSFKIRRTWYAVDWCDPFYEESHIQVIKVTDSIPPQIQACPDDLTLNAGNNSCLVSIPFGNVEATDGCDPDPQVSSITIRDSNDVVVQNPVPAGQYTVEYCIEDDCGNRTCCTQQVLIIDYSPPIAICDQNTVVSLTSTGQADICWQTIDDGSYDNCGIDHIELSRTGDDDNYAPCVTFDCDDLGQNKVYLRVWDKSGHSNVCWANIQVDDKLPPVIQCPPDVSIDCFTDPSNPDNTGGIATAMDACDIPNVDFSDTNLNTCEGVIERTWSAYKVLTGFNGPDTLMVSCIQEITVVDTTPPVVTFPEDFTYSCDDDIDLDPDVTGYPDLEFDCEMLGVSYDDETFYFCHPSGYKIRRVWHVADWCDPNYNLTHVQIIQVMDNEPPEIQAPDTIVTAITINDCEEYVDLVAAVTDNCSAVTVTNDSPYSLDNDEDASGFYPKGTWEVTFTATDKCGNISEKTVVVIVRDDKAPSPVCWTTSLNLKSTLITNLTPAMLDAGSTDNCTFSQNLDFKLERVIDNVPQGQVDELIFTCDDLGPQFVRLHVYDANGNSAFCLTTVYIQDNNDYCDNVSSATASVSGYVTNEYGDMISGAYVEFENHSMPPIVTDYDGQFTFDGVPTGQTYRIKATKSTGWQNGVTTLDIVLIRKHLLDILPFDSPYKWFAADVDNSGTVSTIDIVHLRKVILNIEDEFPNNDSWRFLDAAYEFTTNQPLKEQYPEYVRLYLQNDMASADLLGVKVGDINGNALPGNATNSVVRNTQEPLMLEIPPVENSTGNHVQVPVRAATDFTNLAGFQMALQYDAGGVQLVDIEGNMDLPLTDDHIHVDHEAGIIYISWDNPGGYNLAANEWLFTMTLESETIGSSSEHQINLAEEYMQAEAYSNGLEIHPVELRTETPFASAFALYQNVPNPFDHRTLIGFDLDQTGTTTLRIMDISGKVIWSRSERLDSGHHEWVIQQGPFETEGIYFYQLEGPSGVLTRKMIFTR